MTVILKLLLRYIVQFHADFLPLTARFTPVVSLISKVGIEPATNQLIADCSTTELHWQNLKDLRAEDEAQTRDPQLGRLMLYQLSYFRIDSEESAARRAAGRSIRVWARMDSNHRSRKTADLQSAPFGHSGTRPNFI